MQAHLVTLDHLVTPVVVDSLVAGGLLAAMVTPVAKDLLDRLVTPVAKDLLDRLVTLVA